MSNEPLKILKRRYSYIHQTLPAYSYEIDLGKEWAKLEVQYPNREVIEKLFVDMGFVISGDFSTKECSNES